MKIGIDVDGVLTDYEFYLDFFAKKLDSQLQINECEDDLKKRYGWSEEQEWRFHKKHFLWYVMHMPIRENAATTIKALKNEGHKIYIITARAYADRNSLFGGLMRLCLKWWLRRNSVEYDEIVFVDMKNSANEKSDLASRFELDYFIEDTPKNIVKLTDKCNVICIRAGYNAELQNVRYANDFYDVYSIINNNNTLEDSYGDDELQKIYYSSLPYDKSALTKYKRNTRIELTTLGTLMRGLIKVEITGRENIPDADGIIFVCNHRRSLDIPLAYITLNDRYARFLIKKEYELLKFRFIQKPLGTIYVNRNSKYSSKAAQTAMIETVLHGDNILIFPEGTRNRTEEVLLPFRYGAVKIAQITGAPIVPMTIKKNGKRNYSVSVGKTFSVTDDARLENQNAELREKMRAMLGGM